MAYIVMLRTADRIREVANSIEDRATADGFSLVLQRRRDRADDTPF